MHSEKDVFCLCRLPKSCFMEAKCPYREFRSSDSPGLFCRFVKSNEVAFSSSLHPRNAPTPDQELLFWKNGQFCCQDYLYRNVISVLGETFLFPDLQFYFIPGRNLLLFVSVHCKKAQQAPKAHPLLESSDLSQIYQEPFAITARAVTVLLMGDVGSPLQHWSLGFCNQNPC